MIAESEYIFFLSYIILSLLVGLAYLKVSSTDAMTITTKDFKSFQLNFLFGYMAAIFGEVLCVATFYQVLVASHLTMHQITKLFIVSVSSSTLLGVIAEMIDLGSRRDKCVLSMILYFVASVSLYVSNYEILLLGRIVYGGGSVLLHSAFDAYMVHEHTTQGFPDDWLLQTFGKLAHAMTVVAMSAGFIGQFTNSMGGNYGCVGLSSFLFILLSVFIMSQWSKDVSSSRFMLSSFQFSLGQSIRSMKTNIQIPLLVLLSACAEASILIFSFYWAPWITSTFSSELIVLQNHGGGLGAAAGSSRHTHPPTSPASISNSDSSVSLYPGAEDAASSSLSASVPLVLTSPLPYVLIYATLMLSTMFGNYLHSLSTPYYGNDVIFQAVLGVSTGAYFIGAIVHTPSLAFVSAVCIQLCSGGFWPSVGFLRGRYFLPETRGVTVALTRVLSLCIVVTILELFYHSAFMVLMSCCVLNAIAMYLQFLICQAEIKLQATSVNPYEEEEAER